MTTSILLEVMRPILRDIEAAGGVVPDIDEDHVWHPDPETVSAMIGKPELGYQGIALWPAHSPGVRLAELAEQVQEREIEALAATGGNSSWPECPAHRNRHSLRAEARNGQAVWWCPGLL